MSVGTISYTTLPVTKRQTGVKNPFLRKKASQKLSQVYFVDCNLDTDLKTTLVASQRDKVPTHGSHVCKGQNSIGCSDRICAFSRFAHLRRKTISNGPEPTVLSLFSVHRSTK